MSALKVPPEIPDEQCPYVSCGKKIPSGGADQCVCEYKCPLVKCPACPVTNRIDARYCRACGTGLPTPQPAAKVTPTPVDFIDVPGDFCLPPQAHQGFLWYLTASGAVIRVAPRKGAKPLTLASIAGGASFAGYNRFALVDAMEAARPYRGPVLMGADPAGIYAVSLLTGSTAALYRPGPREEIIANSSVEEAIHFRGVTVSPEMYCFLTRIPGATQARLIVNYFHPQRAGEETRTIQGKNFLAPVIRGDRIGVCSDEEVSIYSLSDQTNLTFRLPRNFQVFFKRPHQINIPLGCVPFAFADTDQGLTAFIAGLKDNRPGMLQIRMERQFHDFKVYDNRYCVANVQPGGLTVNGVAPADCDFLGTDRPSVRLGDMQPGMPVAYEKPYLAYFARCEEPGKRRLTVFTGMPVDFTFQDAQLTIDNCCLPIFCADGLVVNYLIRPATGSGGQMRSAFCRLSA
jgi:hypothetical protein